LTQLVLRAATVEGLVSTSPDLAVYKFSRPSTFTKTIAQGLTLGVVLQGTKRARVNGSTLTVDPSHFLVVTREAAHESAVIRARPEEPCLGLSLCFPPERVARALVAVAEAGGDDAREVVPAFLLPADRMIEGALERLLLANEKPVDQKLLAPLATDEILLRLLRSDAAAAVRSGVTAPDAERILRAMHFIRAHLGRPLSVQQVARHVAMSPSHFAHRFRAVARVSPMRYVRNARLDEARALLAADDARAADVAVRVGFDSPAHFAREFKRRFGTPPSRFLRRAPISGSAD
jgi:AraC-like DNA-binding protein